MGVMQVETSLWVMPVYIPNWYFNGVTLLIKIINVSVASDSTFFHYKESGDGIRAKEMLSFGSCTDVCLKSCHDNLPDSD